VASLKEKIAQAKNDLNELTRNSEVKAGLWTTTKRDRDEAYKMLDCEDSRKKMAVVKHPHPEVIDLVMSSDDEDDDKAKAQGT
jgi:hypothetical protein